MLVPEPARSPPAQLCPHVLHACLSVATQTQSELSPVPSIVAPALHVSSIPVIVVTGSLSSISLPFLPILSRSQRLRQLGEFLSPQCRRIVAIFSCYQEYPSSPAAPATCLLPPRAAPSCLGLTDFLFPDTCTDSMNWCGLSSGAHAWDLN